MKVIRYLGGKARDLAGPYIGWVNMVEGPPPTCLMKFRGKLMAMRVMLITGEAKLRHVPKSVRIDTNIQVWPPPGITCIGPHPEDL